jgi:AcrR family transcriptional regulator
MDARTRRSELTRAAIIDAGLRLVCERGLDAITVQAVADRTGLTKSGVFSRIGSRVALQRAIIEELDRRVLAGVFLPALQLPKGLPRLDQIVRGWFAAIQHADCVIGCITGVFPLGGGAAPPCFLLHDKIKGWRELLRGTVIQAVEAGHLSADTDPQQVVSEFSAIALGLIHDARLLRDARAGQRAWAMWIRLLQTRQA